MSETDDAFWEEMYDNYVEDYINDKYPEGNDDSFQFRQGLVAGDGEAQGDLHNLIFNKILAASKLPRNKGIGYFKDVRRHGMVAKPGREKLEKIAQTKLEDSVGKEEKTRLDAASKSIFEIIERGQKPAKVLKDFREKKIVTTSAEKRREELEVRFLERRESAEILEKRGKTTSAFFRRLGSASSREEVDVVVSRAEEELSGRNLAEIKKAAETRRGEF